MTTLLGYTLLFALVGAAFVFINLMIGKLFRPAKPTPEKQTPYECGEPIVGSSWIQFDIRYYVIALLFIIFDVEVVFFFPWAVVFGKLNALGNPALTPPQRADVRERLLPPSARSAAPVAVDEERLAANRFAWIAFADILVFFGVLLVGFAYLWSRGDLEWVRSIAAERAKEQELAPQPPPELTRPPLVGAGSP